MCVRFLFILIVSKPHKNNSPVSGRIGYGMKRLLGAILALIFVSIVVIVEERPIVFARFMV